MKNNFKTIDEKCKVKDCYSKHYAKKYCKKHYMQVFRYGKIRRETIFNRNKIVSHENYSEICLCNNKCKEIAKTKIDKDDLEKIKNHKWHMDIDGYARTSTNRKIIRLHKFLMQAPVNFDIDHINCDKLDNRKQNLRVVTQSQNCMNRKNIKGYCWHKRIKKWTVYITANHKLIYLGYFDKERDAIQTRKIAEQKYFGKFAYH